MLDRLIERRALRSIAALVFLLAACSPSAGVSSATTATPSLAPSAVATVVPSDQPSAAAVAQAIPDGTYVSDTMDVAVIIARIKADTTLTAAQKADLIGGFSGHKTQIVSFELQGGVFTESDAFDGAALEVGAHATFAFPDSHTLVIQEECCGLSTFEVTWAQQHFSLRYTKGTSLDKEGVLLTKTVYETSPFSPVP